MTPDSGIKKDDKNKLNVSFKIKYPQSSANKEVLFDFDINSDTSYGVAEEMVKELQLPNSYVELISK